MKTFSESLGEQNTRYNELFLRRQVDEARKKMECKRIDETTYLSLGEPMLVYRNICGHDTADIACLVRCGDAKDDTFWRTPDGRHLGYTPTHWMPFTAPKNGTRS